jgi:hypothetical protein
MHPRSVSVPGGGSHAVSAKCRFMRTGHIVRITFDRVDFFTSRFALVFVGQRRGSGMRRQEFIADNRARRHRHLNGRIP